jgi:hypothetical protein
VERRAFLDVENGGLWTKPGRLLSADVAPEIGRLFSPVSDRVRLLARSLLETGFSDDHLQLLLHDEGIRPVEPSVSAGEDSIAPTLDAIIIDFPEPVEPGETEERETESPAGTAQLTKHASRQIVDPEALYLSRIVGPSSTGAVVAKTFGRPGRQRQAARGSPTRPVPTARSEISTVDKEKAAINLAMQVEEAEGRVPEDVHEQQGLGYDVISRDPASSRVIEIEVKMASPGNPFVMQPNQWEEARRKGPDYYVYVVSGLLQGEVPAVYGIQDPVNALSPAPPSQVQISRWDPESAKRYEFGARRRRGKSD